jgi:drug/metabolite transporter (DMT)-like permease
MGLYSCGLRATSAAYAVAFLNLIPAVALRAERLSLAGWPGRTKLLGAAAGVTGTMVVSLCKGTHTSGHHPPTAPTLSPSSTETWPLARCSWSAAA